MSKLVANRSSEVARPLRVLVPLIKDELAAGDAAGLEHYRRAGEMLLEAKAQVGHGGWSSWVDRNFHLSNETARRYMRLAEATQNGRRRGFSTLSEITEPNRQHHQPAWHEPVTEIISNRLNVNKLAEERQSREKEQRLIHDLGLQLIDIGYKVLASKLHPDKGGSQEAMARLNQVRNRLRSAI